MEFGKTIDIVCDCDEVLTYISPLWTAILHDNYDYFSKWLNLYPEYDKKKHFYNILYRDTFDLVEFFLKDEIDTASEEFKDMKENYFFEIIKQPNFYKMCKPTRMAKALADLSTTSYVKSIKIVSRVVSDKPSALESKTKLLEKIFQDSINKLDIIYLQMGESKGDIIKDLPNVDAYYEDEMSNILDVIHKKDPEKPMDIYVPRLNYNQPDDSLSNLCLSTKTGMRFYDIA